jgi:cytochrome c peroxidase
MPAPVAAAGHPTRECIAGLRAAINELLDECDELAPALVGLTWLASRSYDAATGAGGSDSGAAAAALAERKGGDSLDAARVALRRVGGLYPVVSASDLLTLAGAIAVEHMGGPCVLWRPGRRGAAPESAGGGRKVAPAEGAARGAGRHLGELVRAVRAEWASGGFDDREMVALIGGLALCKGSPARSGDAAGRGWARAPVSWGNEYFTKLLGSTWTLRRHDGPDQFEDGAGGGVMHLTDMALLWDAELRKYVEEYAKDEDSFFEAFASAFAKMSENGVALFRQSDKSANRWYRFW